MTLMPRKLIAEQSSNAKIPAEDLRLALTALWTPGASGANTARQGVLRGSGAPGFTGCQVLSAAASTFTVKQGSFVVQQATTNGGAYIGVIDSDQTLTVTPPGAGQFLAGYVIAHCYDSAYGDAQDGFALEVITGAAAASLNGAAYPAIPANAISLAGFTVTATGTISFTSTAPFTVAHGGILPVAAGDTASGDYDGQWRDEPAKGLQRWYAAASPYSASAGWARPLGAYLGAFSATGLPSSGVQPGDVALVTDIGQDGGTLWVYTAHATNPWRYAESGNLVVANLAARNLISTVGLAYTGLRVEQYDTAFVWECALGALWYPVSKLSAKGWVSTGISAAIAQGANQQVALNTFRFSGSGFTTTNNGIVLPLDGLWVVRGTSYVTGAGTGSVETLVTRTRSGVADALIARVWDTKADSTERMSAIGGTAYALKGGDRLWMQVFVAAGSGSGSVNYSGTTEADGVCLELEWKAPLNGVTPV